MHVIQKLRMIFMPIIMVYTTNFLRSGTKSGLHVVPFSLRSSFLCVRLPNINSDSLAISRYSIVFCFFVKLIHCFCIQISTMIFAGSYSRKDVVPTWTMLLPPNLRN